LLLLCAGVSTAQDKAQEEPTGESAAAIFEQTLAEKGMEAAEARLREMMADTSGAYVFDGRELVRGLPNRLFREGKRAEALRLVELLEPLYGEHPEYWFELGSAHLRADDKDRAQGALGKALEMDPERGDIAWMLRNLEQLLESIRIQIESEGKYAPGENTGIQGPYLGQEPPGRRPEVFAPGILCTTSHEYSISFSPDGREIYVSRSGVGTVVCRWEKEGWTAPEPFYFIDEDHLTEEANVAPDGSRIFFCGRGSLREKRELYQAERVGDGWGSPERLFPGMYATSTLDGTLYYTAETEPPDYGVIVRRRSTADGYSEPEVIEGGMNSEFPDAHPFIAPDESFLLFDTYRKPNPGLYVCFRQPDGSWSDAIALGDALGIPPAGQCALSPDGEFLFFCLRGDMYWVSTEFLEDLRPR
jgi:hypothetical protein